MDTKLNELIKACGKNFYNVFDTSNRSGWKKYTAFKTQPDIGIFFVTDRKASDYNGYEGDTMEEAVENLLKSLK